MVTDKELEQVRVYVYVCMVHVDARKDGAGGASLSFALWLTHALIQIAKAGALLEFEGGGSGATGGNSQKSVSFST
jgi:hypothetical protein